MASHTLGDDQPATTDGHSRGRRITEFTTGDAAAVAALFNSSEEGWPGGFMRGSVMTPEQVLRRQRDTQPLATFLSWEGDEVAGYCSFYDYPGEPKVAAYVGLLNAATRFHGRGHGRDLLRAAVRHAVALGYRRLDLHTWPGNMKAVPLYKKTGFFWVPHTDVHMENYLPLLLTMPALADFWSSADWYATFQRDLSVREDLILDGGMRVYPYEFRQGARFVRATIDATARGLAALETERWSVRCTVDDRRLILGRPRVVRWEVENRTGQPLPLTLIAGAGDGLRLRLEETTVVHDRYSAVSTLVGDADYRAPRHGVAPPRVESLFLLAGQAVRLETGVEIRQPLDVCLEPARVTLTPGVTHEVPLRLRNSMDAPVTAALAVVPSPGLQVDLPDALDGPGANPHHLELALEPQSYAGAMLRMRASAMGVHALDVRATASVGDERLPMPALSIPVPAVGPGEIVSLSADRPAPEHAEQDVNEREVRVETVSHRLVVDLREGGFLLEDPATGVAFVQGRLMAGPPFTWTAQAQVHHEATVHRCEGGVAVTLRGAVPHLPDSVVEHELRLLSDGLLRVQTSVANVLPEARSPEVTTLVSVDREAYPTIVLPTVYGLIASADTEFPDWGDLALTDPAVYTEGWVARQGSGGVAGVLWSEAATVDIGGRSLLGLRQDPGTLRAGQSAVLAPLYIYAGAGTWETVRARWRALLCPGAPREVPPRREVVTLQGGAVSGALLAGREHATLSSVAERAMTGRLTLDTPQGWTVTPSTQDVSGLRVGAHQDVDVTLRRAASGARAARLQVRLRTQRSDTVVLDGAALDLGGEGEIALTETTQQGRRLVTVDNGYLRWSVCPEFLGSVVSLTTLADGIEHLHSAYPAAREFGWMRPWFGGIHAVVYPPNEGDMPSAGHLADEVFEAGEVSVEGGDGRVWRGVAVRSRLGSRGLRGLELHASYLTLPGSAILAVRVAVRNHTTAVVAVQAGVVAYLQPGGTVQGAELLASPAGERRLLRAQRTHGVPADGWVAISSAAGTPVVAAIGGRHMAVGGIDWGVLGAHAGASSQLRLGPGEERGGLFLLALARDDEEARAYGALAGITTLP